jgi:DNA-binding MarR family transcriptional regulator
MAHPCYCATLRTASRKVTSLYDAALAPVGVNLAQFSLLRKIERAGPVSLTELGRLTELDRSTVGRNVKVLERLGFATVTPGADHREATVTLSGSGTQVLQAGAPLWDAAQAGIDVRLGPVHATQLLELLQSI